MKLGISQACYRWVFTPRLRRDQPSYHDRGWPPPYFSSIPLGIDERDTADFLIERAILHGLQALHLTAEVMGDQNNAIEKTKKMAGHGIEWISAAWANWVATGSEFARDYESYVAALRLSAAAGAKVVCTTHSAPLVHNHFTKNPPVATQIAVMIENFARVAKIAESEGVTIAFENHQDYRASEIAQVIEGVNSLALRMNFDTANPITVVEDPVEAARRVARHAVMCHAKDFFIQPATASGLPEVHWAPVGRGSVDFDAILPILQRGVPDPSTFRLCVEVAPLPEHDPEVWVRDSLQWVRQQYGSYLSEPNERSVS